MGKRKKPSHTEPSREARDRTADKTPKLARRGRRRVIGADENARQGLSEHPGRVRAHGEVQRFPYFPVRAPARVAVVVLKREGPWPPMWLFSFGRSVVRAEGKRRENPSQIVWEEGGIRLVAERHMETDRFWFIEENASVRLADPLGDALFPRVREQALDAVGALLVHACEVACLPMPPLDEEALVRLA
ncbi:MAG: hypothetical protein D6771_03760, partial [Zetaproteobacteria bacterium]